MSGPLDVLENEAVWTGKPVGDQATCVVCAWRWPNHNPECVLRAALAAVEQLAEAARPFALHGEWLDGEEYRCTENLIAALARFQAGSPADTRREVKADPAVFESNRLLGHSETCSCGQKSAPWYRHKNGCMVYMDGKP